MTIELKKFDMKYITFDEKSLMIIIIGGEETGKSFLVRDILNHYQNIPIGTVIASSKTKFDFYSKLVSKKLFYDEYNPIIIENIFIRQKMIMSRVEEEIQNKQSTTDPRTIVVLDNCFYDERIFGSYRLNWLMQCVETDNAMRLHPYLFRHVYQE
jgi:nicotinamide riboside kinase